METAAKIGLKTAHESVVKVIFVHQNPKQRTLVLVNFLQHEHSSVFQQYQVTADLRVPRFFPINLATGQGRLYSETGRSGSAKLKGINSHKQLFDYLHDFQGLSGCSVSETENAV